MIIAAGADRGIAVGERTHYPKRSFWLQYREYCRKKHLDIREGKDNSRCLTILSIAGILLKLPRLES